MSNSEEQGTYLITGATGNVGWHLVKELMESSCPALTRNPHKADFPDQVEMIKGVSPDRIRLLQLLEKSD